jgi:hypothetical protein
MSERLTNLDHRRLSPGGLITLPFVARLALGFEKGNGRTLGVAVAEGEVVITPEAGDRGGAKASPKGVLQLGDDARSALSAGDPSRYAMDVDEERRRVTLRPASPHG